MNQSSNSSNSNSFSSRSKTLVVILLSTVFGNEAFSISKKNLSLSSFCRQSTTTTSGTLFSNPNPLSLQKHIMKSRRSLIQVYSCVEHNQIRNETLGEDIVESTNVYGETNYEQHNIASTKQPATIVGEKQVDYVGAGTFGDIMSESTSSSSSSIDEIEKNPILEDKSKLKHGGLVTSTGGTLQSQFGSKISNLTPLDRIALTANGNLQRIFSSYYDAPVHVHVDKCERKEAISSIWLRTVNLSVFGQTFCTASSEVTVHSSQCRELVESGEVGIGQLFRYLDKLPKFTILDAGRNEKGGLWRKYILECNELTCNIHEEFSANAWQIRPRGLDHFNDHDNTF